MSQSSRRVVRRLHYDDNGRTVDVTTTVSYSRPTRTPPPMPSVVEVGVETPPSPPPPPPPRFPISERFMQTVSRAAQFVEPDHPLQTAAESLRVMANRPPVRARRTISVSMRRTRPPHRTIPRKKIIYDIVTADSSKKIDDSDTCPICLERYEEGSKCGVLPCKHGFHDFCIRSWFDVNSSCPLCRLQLE